MNLRESNWSRPIPKPKPKVKSLIGDIADLEQDVQEKMDYLKKKIIVTRKREKVIREESSELVANTTEDLILLIRQNDRMQSVLNDALLSEQDTVRNALRTHPLFQMAMANKGAEETIIWLEDKVFDLSKEINRLFCKMRNKKTKFQDMEMMVSLLEKYPRPGSSPSEINLQDRLLRIRLEIELAVYRRTTSAVLLKKYKEVKDDIEDENFEYELILKEMEKKINDLYAEQAIMNNILCVAQKFQKKKLKDLKEYEKAYQSNYKVRRAQLKKKRKQTEIKLGIEERNALMESRRIQAEKQKINDQIDPKQVQLIAEKQAKLRARIEVNKTKLNRLQEALRVETVDKAILRMKHVVWLAYRLEAESKLKSELHVILEKQRNNLLLFKCHLKYSGFVEIRDYNEKKAELMADRQDIEQQAEAIHEKLNSLRQTSQEAAVGIFTIMKKLGDRSRGTKTYRQRVRIMFNLMETLKDELIEAREQVSDPNKPRKPFLKILKPIRPEQKLVRVGTPPPTDVDTNEIDDAADNAIADRMVPGRAQIKERSKRYLKKVMMKKQDGGDK